MLTELNLDVQKPQQLTLEQWISRQFQIIEDAAGDDPATASADAFTISNVFTQRETFNTTTVTTQQLAEVVATLITYIANRGPRKA